MKTITTERLVLRPFRESDYDDLYEFLSQLRDDEFEGYPGITYENGREHLKYRVGSGDFAAVALRDNGKVIGNIYFHKDESGDPIWKDTFVYAMLDREAVSETQCNQK